MTAMPVTMMRPQSERDVLRDQIREQVRQGLRQAGIDARHGDVALVQVPATPPIPGVPVAPGVTRAPQATIDLIQVQIAAEQSNIQRLTKDLTNPGLTDAAQNAITDQISQSQEHLTSLQSQLERANGIAGRREIRGPDEIPPWMNDLPSRIENIVYSTFLFIGVLALGIPLIRVIGKRVDRKTQIAVAQAAASNSNVEPRLDRIEQAVEAIAIEIERVSEGQRFTNKLMSEMRALPAPAAVDIRAKVPDKEPVRRSE